MVKLVEMDERVTLTAQAEEKNNMPVILINKFNVKPEDVHKIQKNSQEWQPKASSMQNVLQ
jgi:hypothetical protein